MSGHPDKQDSAALPPLTAEVQAFVKKLAAEVSGGQLELPAFPDIVVKVRRALDDEDISPGRLAKIVMVDAGLTARILTMANSVAFARGGPPLTDIKKALIRIGFENVRSAAFAFAMSQLRLAASVQHIRKDLERLWQDSSLTAALAHVLARHTRGIKPDDALVTGLLHNIGKVYILSRLERHSPLMKHPAERAEVMASWNAGVGQAIAENWQMPPAVIQAIAGQDQDERDHLSPPDLTDVLIVASHGAANYHLGDEQAPDPANVRPFEKLQLDQDRWADIIRESREEIDDLRAALGG